MGASYPLWLVHFTRLPALRGYPVDLPAEPDPEDAGSPRVEVLGDRERLGRILADNFERSDFCLFPCEPNRIYTICNNFAGIALKTHDRLAAAVFRNLMFTSGART